MDDDEGPHGVVGIGRRAAVAVAGTTSGGAAGQAERLRAFDGCPAFSAYVRASCAAARRPVGNRRRRAGRRAAASPPAGRPRRPGCADVDVLADERAGGGRRRARPASRPTASTLFVLSNRAAQRSRRPARGPRLARDAAARAGLAERAAPPRHAAARAVTGLAGRRSRQPRIGLSAPWPYPIAHDAHRGRRRATRRRCASSARSSWRARTSTARLVGRAVRIVLSLAARARPPVRLARRGRTATGAATARNARDRAGGRCAALAPGVHHPDGARQDVATGALVQCRSISAAADASRASGSSPC